jgi:chemotaxis-related protein WspB
VLCLLLSLRQDRYAIDVRGIEEVIPFVHVKELPGAPHGVAGLIDYFGEPVPVVDISTIVVGTPTVARLSARIVLIWCDGDAGERRLVGLIVPHATEVLRCDDSDFMPAGIQTPDAKYLGAVFLDDRGIIQRMTVGEFLTDDIRRAMFAAPQAA